MDAGEIKRMYVRPKFRGEKLGDLLIGEVIDILIGNGLSKLYLDTAHVKSSAIFYTSNLDLMKQLFIQKVLSQKYCGTQ